MSEEKARLSTQQQLIEILVFIYVFTGNNEKEKEGEKRKFQEMYDNFLFFFFKKKVVYVNRKRKFANTQKSRWHILSVKIK